MPSPPALASSASFTSSRVRSRTLFARASGSASLRDTSSTRSLTSSHERVIHTS